ncbi:MAG TPA: dihydrolipoamide acetyltransferase family protein [Bacteroidales bacterium]|nr:dihydrolipoamide acetyltransferase family protein [Bacteroidales bacterium]
MATAVIMPKQGQSVETCIITKWFKEKGESVSQGDILLSYETDKAAFDIESPADGILLERFFSEGDEVPVLLNIAVIGNPGESAVPFKPGSEEKDKVREGIINKESEEEIDNTSVSTVRDTGKIRISPRARKLAGEKNIDYSKVRGSGPNNRIVISDIENLLAGKLTAEEETIYKDKEYSDAPLSNMRKLIASAMFRSLSESAQVTHHMSADVRRLLESRKKIKEEIKSGGTLADITLNDMICWCVIRALEKFPVMNSHLYDNNSLRTFRPVHLGLAVDTPRGLMVPVVKNAGQLSPGDLSKELKSVTNACRKGSIDPELIKSEAATFTVSNLGGYGVEMFTPVINLPQTGILGVCTIINRPADLGNNIFGFVPYIGLSLTYDHRAVDGGPATLFLKEIKEQIESFVF